MESRVRNLASVGVRGAKQVFQSVWQSVDVWEAIERLKPNSANGQRRRLSLRYAAVDDAANVALLALWNDPVFGQCRWLHRWKGIYRRFLWSSLMVSFIAFAIEIGP